jgi:GTPase SAR1 family protein
LIGGLGFTVGAWALTAFDSNLTDFADSAVWGIAVLGSGIWWLRQRSRLALNFNPQQSIDRTGVEQALAQVETRINQLVTESQAAQLNPEQSNGMAELVFELRQQLARVAAEMERTDIRLAVTGGKAVGKTTLIQLLQQQKLPAILSTPSELMNTTATPAVSPESGAVSKLPDNRSADPNRDLDAADLVLFVTTGDLRDSEFRAIEPLIKRKQRVLLLFNKQDQYLPDERPLILQQLRERMQELLPDEDVLAIAAQPAPVIVRQQQADGSVQERLEQPEPDIALLQARLKALLIQESSPLVLSTVLRQAHTLNAAVQHELNQFRRTRALPIIEQYQWIAAAAAFANPVPSLDLIATASVTAQLVIDLGAIYQQSFSIDQAKTVMVNLAEQMVKLGLVEVATQAISPLLKSHALTYVAGGTLQGLSAAYLTRIVGLSLVEYFEAQSLTLNAKSDSVFQLDRLVQAVKTVLQENQRSVFVQNLVKQGLSKLLPQATRPQVKAEATSEVNVEV